VPDKEIGKVTQRVIGVELSLRQDGDALPTESIDDRQTLYGMAIMRAICHDVIGRDVVAMGGPEPDTRPMVEPQPCTLGLFLGNLQPPYPFLHR
jgi:hypothetical protein